MKKLIMTRGLPASGKSTWAKQYVKDNPNTIRINKDDMRSMLHNGVHSKGREQFILKTRDWLVEQGLLSGHDVIVDDTNFNSFHETTLRNLAAKYEAQFIVEDFTKVSLDECIKRDSMRINSVGIAVIKRMYNEYLKPKAIVMPLYEGMPYCYIFDIDGTLAIKGDRSPYEWNRVGEDMPNIPVVETFKNLADNFITLIFSGRDSVCRPQTEKWLRINGIEYDMLIMRVEGDMTKDSLIKEQFYKEHVLGKYNVLGIFDDRNQVVDMWRSLGLPCYQVAEGDF